jgi:hypothetical protein
MHGRLTRHNLGSWENLLVILKRERDILTRGRASFDKVATDTLFLIKLPLGRNYLRSEDLFQLLHFVILITLLLCLIISEANCINILFVLF